MKGIFISTHSKVYSEKWPPTNQPFTSHLIKLLSISAACEESEVFLWDKNHTPEVNVTKQVKEAIRDNCFFMGLWTHDIFKLKEEGDTETEYHMQLLSLDCPNTLFEYIYAYFKWRTWELLKNGDDIISCSSEASRKVYDKFLKIYLCKTGFGEVMCEKHLPTIEINIKSFKEYYQKGYKNDSSLRDYLADRLSKEWGYDDTKYNKEIIAINKIVATKVAELETRDEEDEEGWIYFFNKQRKNLIGREKQCKGIRA